jgi:hypothetical protein
VYGWAVIEAADNERDWDVRDAKDLMGGEWWRGKEHSRREDMTVPDPGTCIPGQDRLDQSGQDHRASEGASEDR